MKEYLKILWRLTLGGWRFWTLKVAMLIITTLLFFALWPVSAVAVSLITVMLTQAFGLHMGLAAVMALPVWYFVLWFMINLKVALFIKWRYITVLS